MTNNGRLERCWIKSLEETFFVKVLSNLLPFDGSDSIEKSSIPDEEEKVPMLKNKNSGWKENQKMGVSKNCKNDEKPKKSASGKKASKPPRHPSFDAASADKKLVREIVQVAWRERAIIERIKSAKKAKT